MIPQTPIHPVKVGINLYSYLAAKPLDDQLIQRYIKEIEFLLVAQEIYSGILGKNDLGYR